MVEAVRHRLREQVFTEDPVEADFVLVAQCFSHEFVSALQLCRAQADLAGPCFAAKTRDLDQRIRRWIGNIARGSLHRRCNGSNFMILTSAEDGRLAFSPFAHTALRNWAFLTPNGPASWLRTHFPAETLQCPWHPYPDLPWDVVVPFPSLRNQSVAVPPGDHRARLAFFAGHADSCVRRKLFGHFGCDLTGSGVAVCESLPKMHEYGRLLQRSVFCLVPDGRSSPWNTRFVEAVAAGCIPTVISDDFHPPFHRTIAWASIAVFVRTEQISNLERILRAFSSTEIQQRQEGLVEIAPLLDPRDPGYWRLLLAELQEGAAARDTQRSAAMGTE